MQQVEVNQNNLNGQFNDLENMVKDINKNESQGASKGRIRLHAKR